MNRLYELRHELLKKMLQDIGSWSEDMRIFLEGAEFEAQDDGGMGSFSILKGTKKTGAKDIAEAKFTDDDGKEVVIALIVDESGYPTDIDFWKVDTSPLMSFPTPKKIFSTRK